MKGYLVRRVVGAVCVFIVLGALRALLHFTGVWL